MANSSNENSVTDKNRYGFHSFANSEKLGAPDVEFAYNQVVSPVTELLDKATKAVSFKPDNAANKAAVSVLKNCSQQLKVILKEPNLEAIEQAHNDEGSAFRP